MEDGLSLLESTVLPWGLRAIVALLILLVGLMLARKLTALAKSGMRRSRVEATLVDFFGSLVYTFLLLIVAIVVLDAIGFNTTSLLAILGTAGLAIGLALKDSLANIASGLMIILFRPFRNGDSISASGVSGIVDNINLFSTVLRTPDNQRIIVPNATIFRAPITNASALQARRVDMNIAIAAQNEPEHARAVILEVLRAEPRVLREPAPQVLVSDLTGSQTILAVRPWAAAADHQPVRAALLENIKGALERAGIKRV